MHQGLGLMFENNDDMMYDLHATKVLVGSEAEEGFDIEVGEWVGG